MKCIQCGIEFEAKRDTAKFCSPRCRLIHHRRETLSETGNVKVSSETLKDETFKFYTQTLDRETAAGKVAGEKSEIRMAKYWYDVPLGAIPVKQNDWPDMPDFMNGRQYFLWWKNEFKKQTDGTPIIHNPFPVRENLIYKPMSSQLGV